MKNIFLLLIISVLLLAGCSEGKNTNASSKSVSVASSTECLKNGLIYDNDEDPDWEIDLDGDCEGDIEFEGNEKKTKYKPTDKSGVINKTTNKNSSTKSTNKVAPKTEVKVKPKTEVKVKPKTEVKVKPKTEVKVKPKTKTETKKKTTNKSTTKKTNK